MTVPSTRVKMVIIPQTKAGLGRAGLRSYLAEVHGPLVMSEPSVSACFARYAHHYVRALSACVPWPELVDRDAITIIEFEDPTQIAVSQASPAYREIIAPDEDNFRDIAGSVLAIADEVVVQAGVTSAAMKLFVFRTVPEFDRSRLGEWAERLQSLAAGEGWVGMLTNLAVIRGGQFQFAQFDEIGLDDDSDLAAIVGAYGAAAMDFFGEVETRVLLTDQNVFVSGT